MSFRVFLNLRKGGWILGSWLSGDSHTGLSSKRWEFVSRLKLSIASNFLNTYVLRHNLTKLHQYFFLNLTTWFLCLNFTKHHRCFVPKRTFCFRIRRIGHKPLCHRTETLKGRFRSRSDRKPFFVQSEAHFSSCFLWAVGVLLAANAHWAPPSLDALCALHFWRSTLNVEFELKINSEREKKMHLFFSYCPVRSLLFWWGQSLRKLVLAVLRYRYKLQWSEQQTAHLEMN